METTQALLTVVFNIVCIGYTTLCAANFVCGLCEEWMKSTHSNTSSATADEEEQIIDDAVIKEIPYGWDVVEPMDKDIAYELYTIRQLKALAKKRHIPKYGDMKKTQLIDVLFA